MPQTHTLPTAPATLRRLLSALDEASGGAPLPQMTFGLPVQVGTILHFRPADPDDADPGHPIYGHGVTLSRRPDTATATVAAVTTGAERAGPNDPVFPHQPLYVATLAPAKGPPPRTHLIPVPHPGFAKTLIDDLNAQPTAYVRLRWNRQFCRGDQIIFTPILGDQETRALRVVISGEPFDRREGMIHLPVSDAPLPADWRGW